MSYDSKLAQTGRRVANARRKYYGSFDYGSGIDARLRGGTFSFGKKFEFGGNEDWVDEPDVQAMIAKYFRKHPNDAWKFDKDPETGLDYGAGFEGMSSGGTNWGGLATLGLSIAGGGVQSYSSMKAKNDALNHKYNVFGTNEFTGLTDNNALLSTMANTPMLSGATAKDFRDKSIGQDVLSIAGAGVSGAKNGGIYGALAGMALKGLQIGGERWNAKILADNAAMEAKRKNLQFLKDMNVASQDVDVRNDWTRMLGYYNDPYIAAFGGPLHSNGGDYNGGITYINEGGRHEENPYEGVPSGFDEKGNPNLVEEGEVIWNNEYVFSDRLKVPKELANKYKLGGKKDYTFAEAIEKLTKENNISPNDFITIATTKEIVNEFMDAQETIREENQLAAREELEAAQAQDFLAQLNAAQGMAPSMGAPIDLGQMSALPNEAPVTEGEMTPPGYAFGGNKFDGGGNKLKYEGPYIYTTDGRRFMSRSLAEKWQDKIDYANHEAFAPEGAIDAGYIVDTKPRSQQTLRVATDKDFEISEVLTDSYTTDLQRRKGYKVGNQVYLSRKDAENAADSLRLEYATTLRYIQGYGKGYRLSDGTIVLTKGEAKRKQKELNKKLRASSNQSSGNSATTTRQAAEQAAMEDIARVTGTTRTASTTSTARRSSGVSTGIPSTTGTPAPTDGTMPEINSWESLYNALKEYNGSLGASNASGKYAIDRNAKYWNNRSAVDIQNGADYQAFTKWVKEHKDDPNVQRYFEYLDKGINKSKGAKTLLKYDKDGKTIIGLADDWEKTFERRRTDNALGIYHLNPTDIGFLFQQATQSPSDKQKALFELLNGIKFSGYLDGYPNIRTAVKDGKTYYLDPENGKLYDNVNDIPGYKAPEKPKTNGLESSVVAGTKGNEPLKGTKPISDLNATEHDDVTSFKYRPTWQREVPVIGSAMAALYGMFNRPDYTNADEVIKAARTVGLPINIPVETIGDYRKRNPYDERYLVNLANQNRAAGVRTMANTSGGNRSMDMLGAMTLAHSNQYDLGEIMRQAYLANRQDDAQVADFNRGTNVYNMSAINQRNLTQAQLNSARQQAMLSGLERGYTMRQNIKDNWDDFTTESFESTLASLGAIGKENEEYNILTSMAEQGSFPWYYGDRSILQYIPQKTSKGGKLNRKKRRF